MSILVPIAIGLAAVVTAAVLPLLGVARLALVALVLSLVLVPYPLIDRDVEPEHHGMTSGSLVPYTFSVTIVVCLILLLRDRGVRRWATISLGISAYLILLLVFVWGNTGAQQAGVAHLATGLLAFAVGIGVGSLLMRDLEAANLWVWALLVCLTLQLLIMCAQMLGVPIGLYSTTAYFVDEGRPIGTFIHPSVPGKIALLSLSSLLVFTRVSHRRLALLAWIAIGMAIAVTVLTQSRSNTVAVLGALAIWFMLDFRLRPRQRWTFVSIVGLLSIPAAVLLLPRILNDPEGGDRAQLLATALREIPHHLAFGLGANNYSNVVGQYDPLAAAGLPVHNTFLHSVAEVGVAGTLLLLLPVVATLVRVCTSFRDGWPHADAARAMTAILPGIALIYVLGWGLLLQGVLAYWMLTFGVAYGMMSVPSASVTVPLDAPDRFKAAKDRRHLGGGLR